MSRRIEGTLDITCELNSEYFQDWNDLTEEQQAMFDDKATRCDGGGRMGVWCVGCDFCSDYEFEDYDAEPEDA